MRDIQKPLLSFYKLRAKGLLNFNINEYSICGELFEP
jgi:hypothetical protein